MGVVTDIIADLLGLDTEPKPESLWWTSTCQAQEKATLKVGYKGLAWDLSFKRRARRLGIPFPS